MFISSLRSCKARCKGARVLLSLALAVLVVPLLSAPVAAGVSQGNTYWYITDTRKVNGQDYYVISLFEDGSRYYTQCIWGYYIHGEHPTEDVLALGYDTDITLNVYHATIVPFQTLNVPRNGFFLDNDWLVDFQYIINGVYPPYNSQSEIEADELYVSLYDPSVMPTLYMDVSGGQLSDTVQYSRVYPFYLMCDPDENYLNGGMYTWQGTSGSGQVRISDILQGRNYTVYNNTAAGIGVVASSKFLVASLEGSNSANVEPIIYIDPDSPNLEKNIWYRIEAHISLEYLCPVSKLESYSVGDLFPHDTLYNIEAILDGLNNGEIEYIQALESASGINSSSVGQYWQNVQNWQNAAGQLGATDDTQSGILALVPFFAAFPLFGAFLLVLVAFGVLYLLIKKAVS